MPQSQIRVREFIAEKFFSLARSTDERESVFPHFPTAKKPHLKQTTMKPQKRKKDTKMAAAGRGGGGITHFCLAPMFVCLQRGEKRSKKKKQMSKPWHSRKREGGKQNPFYSTAGNRFPPSLSAIEKKEIRAHKWSVLREKYFFFFFPNCVSVTLLDLVQAAMCSWRKNLFSHIVSMVEWRS